MLQNIYSVIVIYLYIPINFTFNISDSFYINIDLFIYICFLLIYYNILMYILLVYLKNSWSNLRIFFRKIISSEFSEQYSKKLFIISLETTIYTDSKKQIKSKVKKFFVSKHLLITARRSI